MTGTLKDSTASCLPHQTLTFILKPTKLLNVLTRISALRKILDDPLFEKRLSCISRAACNLVRIDPEDSLTRFPLNLSSSSRGTAIKILMRSRNAMATRF
jgi:hypothetical protein